MTVILGVETSCDETSAAVVVDGRDVRSNLVSSQVRLHEKYGGIVPEIASRAHIERIGPLIDCRSASEALPDALRCTETGNAFGKIALLR